MYRFFAPLLSQQFMRAPTGRPAAAETPKKQNKTIKNKLF